MRRTFAIAAALAAGISSSGARAGRLRGRHHGGAHRPAGQHLCAGDRGAAHLSRPRQCGGRHQRQEGEPRHPGRFRRALEGRRERQEAADAGQRRADDQREPVLDLRAGGQRSEECRRAAAVRGVGLPEGHLSAGRRRTVLHDGVRVELRQPRGARLHQGDREGAGEDRLLRDGDPDLARRDRFRREPGRRRSA